MKTYLVGAIAAAAIGLQVMLLTQALTQNAHTAHWAFAFAALISAIALFVTEEYAAKAAGWLAFTAITACLASLALISGIMSMTYQLAGKNPFEDTTFCWYMVVTMFIFQVLEMTWLRRLFHGDPAEFTHTLIGHH